MMRRQISIGFLFLVSLAIATTTTSEDRAVLRGSLLGKAAPELASKPTHWLGEETGVTLAELKGKVVWLQFNF